MLDIIFSIIALIVIYKFVEFIKECVRNGSGKNE